jgi:hypothetical protein
MSKKTFDQWYEEVTKLTAEAGTTCNPQFKEQCRKQLKSDYDNGRTPEDTAAFIVVASQLGNLVSSV